MKISNGVSKKTIIIIIAIIVIVGLGYGAYKYFGPIPASEEEQEEEMAEEIKENDIATSSDSNSNMIAIMQTNFGEIKIELFSDDAPKTVENFVKLSESGFYNATKFHRVIKGFMIQGGDPLSKDDSLKDRWGTGGPGYSFLDEIHSNNHNVVGTISMANAGANTNEIGRAHV